MRHTPAELLGTAIQRLRLGLSACWRWEAAFKGVEFQGRVTMVGRPLISVAHGSHLVLAEGVALVSSLRANPLGCFQPCVLRTLASGAVLRLERSVGLSGAVICAGQRIEIGEGTIVGAGAMILDNDFHRPDGDCGWRNEYQSNARPILIGRGVFIGARAIVLKGVRVGDRAVIGAGAVVTQEVPARHLAVGNPARVIPPRTTSDNSQ
jgi:acetyltransferase-like isoleucine patch superfamily enzyme